MKYDIDPRYVVTIDYTNWRGERSTRKIGPLRIDFTSNEWHPESQWMVQAVDIEKGEKRWFALDNIHSWKKP